MIESWDMALLIQLLNSSFLSMSVSVFFSAALVSVNSDRDLTFLTSTPSSLMPSTIVAASPAPPLFSLLFFPFADLLGSASGWSGRASPPLP